MSRPRVAIVGGGWAGLATAVELLDHGFPITLFESARQPGGRARAIILDGEVFDNGQHLLSGAYEETLNMLRRVGVDPDRALLRTPLRVEFPGQFRLRLPRLPKPLNLASGLLFAKGASLAEKYAAARLIHRLQRAGFRLPEDVSVCTWLDRHGQFGALREYFWQPLCLAALNTPTDVASAQIFANVLRETLGGSRKATDLLIPLTDLSELFPTPAWKHLERGATDLRLSCRVRKITFAEKDASFTLVGAGFTESFRHVVLACAPQHAASLLPAVPALGTLQQTLASFQFEPIATIYSQYPPDVQLPEPLLALPSPPAQWLFDRGQLGTRAGLFAHVISGSGEWQELDNPSLGAALHAALAKSLSDLPPALWHRVIREQRATFSCRANLVRPPNESGLPGLWLAGDYTAGDYPATIEGAVKSARAVARLIRTAVN